MNVDLQLLPTSTLIAMIQEAERVLEIRSESLPATRTSKLNSIYGKQWYFDITNPDGMIEAVNKKNAKNILKCDEKNVRSVLGYIQSKVSCDNNGYLVTK